MEVFPFTGRKINAVVLGGMTVFQVVRFPDTVQEDWMGP
jgi:hypothetical protein